MRHNVWYVFRNKMLKEEFLRNVCRCYGFEINENIVKAEALMLKTKDASISLCYRTKVNADYMSEDIINYEGESCMCESEPMLADETKELDYPVKRFFRSSYDELVSERDEKIKKVIKDTDIYKAAKEFEKIAKKNNELCHIDAYDMCLCGDALSLSTKNKIEEIRKDYNDNIDSLSDNCKLISNLIHQADTFEERMMIMKEYNIL